MRKLPLNRTTAPKVVRLFDVCFKRGVLDACAEEDDFLARDFLEKHKKDGGYGLIYDDENFDWKRWRFTLERWVREYRLGSLADTYISTLRSYTKNFMWAVLPMTMRFYLMGVEEYLEYPNPNNTALFKHETKIHWKPMPQHLRKMKTLDILSYLQQFIYERQELKLEDDLTPRQYDSFAEAMYNLTRKYALPYEPPKEDF